MTTESTHSIKAPTTHWRQLWWVIASLVQLSILIWAARTAIPQAIQCELCDTTRYFNAATEIAKSGLLFTNPYDGYRSYFFPMFIAVVQWMAGLTGFDGNAAERYGYGVTLLFWLLSTGLMWWLSKRVSARTFLLTSAATLLNPFLLVYVPYALQEGMLMVGCLPLLFIWAGEKNLPASKRVALVLMMALLAYIIRASLAWWLLPAIVYAGWLLWPQVRQPRLWLPTLSAVIVAGALLLAPQIYISSQKFGSFNPYPATNLLSQQIAWGISTLKFTAVEDEGHWRQLAYLSPFAAEPEADKTPAFYLDHPARGAFLMLGHAYAGFHYDQIKPYWRLSRARPLTVWLVLSSAIVFLGIVGMSDNVFGGRLDADGAFAIATLGLCTASLLFVATESRFGIIGFTMLSIQVAEWFGSRPTRAQWSLLAPGLLMYLALSFLFNTLLMQSADIKI